MMSERGVYASVACVEVKTTLFWFPSIFFLGKGGGVPGHDLCPR